MLREAARSLVGADEPVADAMMFNDIPRLRIAIATYEGTFRHMELRLYHKVSVTTLNCVLIMHR